MNREICAAIKKKAELECYYKGSVRIIEPQCHGTSLADKEVLRAVQTGGYSQSGKFSFGKLFEVSEMSGIKETGKYFVDPAPNHNPDDKGMKRVHCCLPPRAKNKKAH